MAKRYPSNWPEIRARILLRAKGRCEWCGVENGAIGVRNSKGETGGEIIFTSACKNASRDDRPGGNLITSMIKIPLDAAIIRDSRLTILRVVSTLHDRFKKDGGLSDQIKGTMIKKSAGFAESDHVIARLVESPPRGSINAVAAFAACMAKKIGLEEFFGCCTVRKEALREHLSESEIAAITVPGPAPAPSLFTEFKPALEVDADSLADVLSVPLTKHLAKLAA